ncbi:restriction enzyme (plasmid) [Alkalihalophilus pseudofirmus OF4]|uniref:Restriction enzyme n=1 Tax=Alkalihalophilus pseudofirmus (strain ATCC BAA-2126 / JCM 17055 / OF4) TaxID=398511 RepID=D3G1N6_ALKPO|nr:restriction endonuclease subunit S [Alkalihalophilus pseudofirmus]ADC52262.1 restriction enzyme [Alkalihalophilus pseudofirmus OF4]
MKTDLVPITRIFNINRGDRLKKHDHVPGHTPYISSTKLNNGIDAYVTPPADWPEYSNVISLSNSGSVGYAFYHPYTIIASDHVTILELKDKMLNRNIFLYLKPILEAMKSKYNFGREISNRRIVKEKILLPLTDTGEVDWLYMENKIRHIASNVSFKKIKKQKCSSKISIDNWKEFELGKVVDILPGRRLTKAHMLPGDIPFIGASSKNHGITSWVSNMNDSYDSEVLGVNYNGSIAESFYHEGGALFSDDVKRIKIREEDKPSKLKYLFLKTLIYENKLKYPYGYKLSETRMRNMIIKMPEKDNKPDWDYMSGIGYANLLK